MTDVLVCPGCLTAFKDTPEGREGMNDHECQPPGVGA